MEELGTAAGWGLRLIGAFYALAGVLGLRRLAMDVFLTRAIAALAPGEPREASAEARRAAFQVAQLLLVGIAGIMLMALLDMALAVFLVSMAFYALYLFASTRFLDPLDPPDAVGLAQRRRAFWIYLAATALIAAAAWGGLLRLWREEAWPVLALVVVLTAALLGYAWHLFRRMPATLTPGLGDGAVSEESLAFEARRRSIPLILSPSWSDGALFEAETRQSVLGLLPPDMLTQEDEDLIQHWLGLARDLLDPADPEQCRFRTPEGAVRMEEEGRPIFEQLAQRFAPGQLSFEPTPWPRHSLWAASAVKLMTDAGAEPLWVLSEDIHQPISPRVFGLSWTLTLDIRDWRLDHDEAVDWDNPGNDLLWSAEEAAAHEARGHALAIRLAREMVATGRGHVPVTFWSESAQAAIPIQPG